MVNYQKDAPTPAPEPTVFKAHLATVTLHPDRVEIRRSRMAKIAGNKDNTIPLRDVIKIQSTDPTLAINGHVHLATEEDRGRLTAFTTAPQKQIAGNPRAIMFTYMQRDRMAKLLAAVDAAWRAVGPGPLT